MFSWFHNDEPEEVKKEGPFTVSWYRKGGPLVPGDGMEISETGLVFTTHMPPPDYKEFNIEFELREKKLHARVSSKKPQLISTPKGLRHKFVCTFQGISADEWDLVVRYVNDMAEAAHEGSYYDPSIPDDDFRSLPTVVQQKIIEDLARKERLEEPPPHVAPLIRMTMNGQSKAKDGTITKKVTIHSRIVIPGEEAPKDFDTKYAVDDKSNVVCLTEEKKK